VFRGAAFNDSLPPPPLPGLGLFRKYFNLAGSQIIVFRNKVNLRKKLIMPHPKRRGKVGEANKRLNVEFAFRIPLEDRSGCRHEHSNIK